jgi:hypothetical protein
MDLEWAFNLSNINNLYFFFKIMKKHNSAVDDNTLSAGKMSLGGILIFKGQHYIFAGTSRTGIEATWGFLKDNIPLWTFPVWHEPEWYEPLVIWSCESQDLSVEQIWDQVVDLVVPPNQLCLSTIVLNVTKYVPNPPYESYLFEYNGDTVKFEMRADIVYSDSGSSDVQDLIEGKCGSRYSVLRGFMFALTIRKDKKYLVIEVNYGWDNVVPVRTYLPLEHCIKALQEFKIVVEQHEAHWAAEYAAEVAEATEAAASDDEEYASSASDDEEYASSDEDEDEDAAEAAAAGC